jgi:hypothetical protein
MLVNLASHVEDNTVHIHRYDNITSNIDSGYVVKVKKGEVGPVPN